MYPLPRPLPDFCTGILKEMQAQRIWQLYPTSGVSISNTEALEQLSACNGAAQTCVDTGRAGSTFCSTQSFFFFKANDSGDS